MLSPPAWGHIPHVTAWFRENKRGGRDGGGGVAPLHRVSHTQEKHFKFPKCQWTITVGRLMRRCNMRAMGPDVRQASSGAAFLGYTVGGDLRPSVRERTVKVPRLGGR